MLTALIGPIASLAGTWLDGKVEQTKATATAKVAKAKAEATIMEKKATGEIDWDCAAVHVEGGAVRRSRIYTFFPADIAERHQSAGPQTILNRFR